MYQNSKVNKHFTILIILKARVFNKYLRKTLNSRIIETVKR